MASLSEIMRQKANAAGSTEPAVSRTRTLSEIMGARNETAMLNSANAIAQNRFQSKNLAAVEDAKVAHNKYMGSLLDQSMQRISSDLVTKPSAGTDAIFNLQRSAWDDARLRELQQRVETERNIIDSNAGYVSDTGLPVGGIAKFFTDVNGTSARYNLALHEAEMAKREREKWENWVRTAPIPYAVDERHADAIREQIINPQPDPEEVAKYNEQKAALKAEAAAEQAKVMAPMNQYISMTSTMHDNPFVAAFNYYVNYLSQSKAQMAYEQFTAAETEAKKQEVIMKMQEWAKENPWKASGASLGTSLLSGADYITNAVETAVTGNARPKSLPGASETTQALRSGVAENMGGTGQFLYHTGMSAADSVAAGLIGRFVGGGSTTAGVILGMGAASNAANDIKARGGSDQQALIGGAVAGVLEGVFEKLSIGELDAMRQMKGTTVKTLLSNVSKSVVTNASEETATELGNIIFDTVFMGQLSEYQTDIKNYMAQGMAEESAKVLAMAALRQRVGSAALSGALMGILFGAGSSAISAASEYAENHKTYNVKNFNSLVKYAMSFPEDSASYQMASQLKGEKNVSSESEVALIRTIAQDIEQGKNKVEKTAPAASQTAQESRDPMKVLFDAAQKKQEAEKQNVSDSNTKAETQDMRAKLAEKLESGEITGEQYDAALESIGELESIAFEEGESLDIYNPNMMKKTEVNTDGRSNLSDEGSEWAASQSAGEQAGELAEGTGRDQSGEVQAQRAASRRDDVARYYESAGQQPVNAKEYLGSESINKVSTLQEVPAEMIAADSELQSIEQDIRAMGLTPHIFVGDVRLTNGNTMDALIRDNDVFVRADSDAFTATQNWEHEKAHAIFRQSPGIESELYKQIVGKGEAARRKLHQTIKKYRDAYHGIYDVDQNGNEIWNDEVLDKIMQEVLADAYAGKDTFAQGVEEYTDMSRDAASQIESWGGEVRGPPEGSMAVSVKDYHTENQKQIIREYNAAVDTNLLEYVERVKSQPNAYAPDFHLGQSTVKAVNDIMREIGVDTTGFDTVIKKTDVEHILKRHGENGEHDHSMSDLEDIARIKYVLDNYDNVVHDGGTTKALRDRFNNPAKTVIFSKKINGTYYVVEAVADNKSRVTRVISAFMSKDGDAQVADVQAPSLTSENEPASTPVLSVSQGSDAVKNGESFSAGDIAQKNGADIIESMPTKARKVMERAEKKLQRSLSDVLNLPKMPDGVMDEVSREISREFLETGTVSDETIDRTFEKVYSAIEDKVDEQYGVDAEDRRKWAERDYVAEIQKHLAEMRLVKRYADEKAQQQTQNEQDKAMTLSDLKKVYTDLKAARRVVDKAVARNLLTEQDNRRVNQLLRGDIDLDMLQPGVDNVRGITEVYNAKLEYEKFARQIRRWNAARKEDLRALADKLLATASDWKDKGSGWLYSRETMEQNIRDIVPDKKIAQEIIDTLFKPIHDGAAAANRMKNQYRDRVRKLELSRKVEAGNTISEAAAVQLLGEAEDNIRHLEQNRFLSERDGKSLEDWQGIVRDLWEQNPSLDAGKIRRAVKEFREIYDELFEQMNEVRMRNGYEPVNYRKGYFPHFQSKDGDGILGKFGKSLGINTAAMQLPTTINGMTHNFKPGIQWFGSAQQRMGVNTSFDALEGFDSYIEGVADVIHQTDNIQRLRAFAAQVRYRTSEEGIRKQVDAIRNDPTKAEDDKRRAIEEKYAEGKFELNNLIVELDEYTNLLAGKKSRHDRDMEQRMGRGMYAIMKWAEKQIGANMVAVNPASWLTNFIPIQQAWSVMSTRDLLSGMYDTLRSYKQDDGFAASSAFLTNRRGSDPLVKTWLEQTSGTLSKPMEWIDTFTADTIVRARYNENIRRGLSEDAAMADADAFAASIMADRSKGAMPTIFSQTNPLTKLFTQFQLEVNNQLSFVFKDMPKNTREKGLKALALELFKFALGGWLYNELYEWLIGRRPALDPINMVSETVSDIGEHGVYTAGVNLAGSVAEELPFIGGLLGGGRLPISSALPDVGNFWRAISDSNWAPEKRVSTAIKEIAKPATYLALPFGGGQVKKIAEGVSAIAKGGSYSVDRNGEDILQYPVYNSTPGEAGANAVRALLFGKSSLPTAREWVDSDFDSLGAKQTALYDEMRAGGASGRDVFEMIRNVEAADTNMDKIRAVAETSFDEPLKILAMANAMSESQFEKYRAATNAGVSTIDYVSLLQAIAANSASRGSKSANQEDVKSALNASNLTAEQKRAIWNSYSWKAESPW